MFSINISTTRRIMTEIGTAMVPVSMPLGMILKITTGNMIIGNLMMGLGLLMMFPFRRIKYGFRLGYQTGIIAFFILSFIYYFASKFAESIYLLYLGVSLIYSLALSILRYDEDLKMKNVIFDIWSISLLCILGSCYCFATGIITALTGAFEFTAGGDTLYDALTMGSVGITQMSCSFYFLGKSEYSKKFKIILFACVTLDFFIVLLAFKRTPILISLITFALYSHKLGYLKMTPKKIIGIVIIMIILSMVIVNSAELSEAVTLLAEDTWEGIVNLITNNHTGHSLTNSTDIRIENRQQAFAMINDFDMLEFFLGAGFMTFWFDMPLLQSYLDMGVIGFILFAFFVVYLPLRILFSKYRSDDEMCFIAIFSLYGAIGCLTSGHPYAHTHWMPICLLCFILDSRRSIKS